MARDHGAGRSDARPRVRFAGRAAYGDTRMARGIQRAPFPEARRLPAFRVRIGGEAAADRVAANAVRGGGPGVRQEGAGQRPCSVGAQLVFRPVRVRRLHRGPENRCEHARGPAREHQALHASAPARHRRQPVVDERDGPARQRRVAAMGQEAMRTAGEADRPRLRHGGRQAVRHGTARRPGGGARIGGAAPVETVFRTTVGERVLPAGCAAATVTRTWAGDR